MLSDSNLLLSTTDSELELFQKLCSTIVETGGYQAAWIGVVQHDEEKSVLPVAHAGFEKRYLDTFKVSWADTKRGQGSTGLGNLFQLPSLWLGVLVLPLKLRWLFL